MRFTDFFDISFTCVQTHFPQGVHVYAVCLLLLGDEGEVQLVYAVFLLPGRDVIIDMRKNRGVVCIFSIF